LEDLRVDERIIFEWILGKWVGRFGLESSGSGQEPVMSCCEYDNEPSGFIKGEEFLD